MKSEEQNKTTLFQFFLKKFHSHAFMAMLEEIFQYMQNMH